MAHIQRRCPTCSVTVAKGRRSCARCGGTTFSYRVRYVDPEGREKSKTFRRRADAESFETSTSHSILAGSYVDPVAGRQTVEQYLEGWRLQQSQHRKSSARATKSRFKTLVYPHLGSMPIGRVKPSNVRTWQKTLVDAGRSAATIAAVRGQVSGAFADAVLDKLISSSPFDGVKVPEIVRKRIVPPTIDQVLAGQAAAPDLYAATVPVAAGSGLRAGELFGLTVDRVDFLRKEIIVDRQLIGRDEAGEPVFGPPKTPASNASVPVGDMVLKALAEHLRKYPAGRHQLIFRNARGLPVARSSWNDVWAKIAAAMGLDVGEGLHQLRHFYASLLIADGRNVKEVQERMRHASAKTTLDDYSHLFPGSEDSTRSAVDRAFAKPRADGQEKAE